MPQALAFDAFAVSSLTLSATQENSSENLRRSWQLSVTTEEAYQEGESQKGEEESADPSGDVTMADKEGYVVSKRNGTFDHSLLPPWSRVEDLS